MPKELTESQIEQRYGDPGKAAAIAAIQKLPVAEREAAYVAWKTNTKNIVPMEQRIARIAESFGYESIEQMEADAGIEDNTTTTENPDNE